MKEYWINVYDKPLYETKINNCQGEALYYINQVKHVTIVLKSFGYNTIYRIHVRIK